MKTVITSLTKDSVKIVIEAENVGTVNIDLPVNMVSPQISLQIAGMLASDPMLCRPKTENND